MQWSASGLFIIACITICAVAAPARSQTGLEETLSGPDSHEMAPGGCPDARRAYAAYAWGSIGVIVPGVGRPQTEKLSKAHRGRSD